MMLIMIVLFLIIMMNLSLMNFMVKIIIQSFMFILFLMLLFNFSNLFGWWMIYMMYGLEFFNYSLILLLFWIFGLIFCSLDLKLIKINYCMNLLMILLLVMLLCFMSMDLFMFYLFFEISLIPTFMLIIYWGLGIERVSSGFYLIFYTMFFSLPMLFVLFNFYWNSLESYMYIIKIMDLELNMMFYLILILSFLVKLPSFLLHSWLLKAHVEAPYFGSMILASLLLKLGSYGLIRLLEMFLINSLQINYFIIILSLVGGLMISLVCLRQLDMKIIVAYSSVVHMGMLLGGMFTLMKSGIIGSYIMMISHGLCSSGLFYLVNVSYEMSNSRLLMINKGLIIYMPIMSLMWFLLCSSNMAAPFSLNLVSEIMLISSMMFYSLLLMIILMLICFFSFIYSLYLFSYLQHGQGNYMILQSGKLNQFFILLMHWIPLNLMFMNLLFFIY